MNPRALRTFFVLPSLALTTVIVHGRDPGASWHGVWTSGDSRVEITAQGIQPGAALCKWVAAKPAKPAGCVAFADQPVAKDQLVRLLDDAELALKEIQARTPANAGLSPAAARQRQTELRQQRQALKAVGAGEFSTVSTAQAGSGDCATYYFLDRASLYQVTDCSSQPHNASLKAYKKSP